MGKINNMKKYIAQFLIIISLLVGGSVYADTAGGSPAPAPKEVATLKNPIRVDSIQDAIFLTVDIAIYIGIIFATLAIIYVGFKFIMAQGKPEEISDLKSWFLYIIIGLAILLSSKIIVEIIKNTLVDAGVTKEEIWKPN